MLFQNLRGFANTASMPVLGLCVKTAAARQARAQQAGFAGVVTKPIDGNELKSKIARALKLDTICRYFQSHEGVPTLVLLKDFHPGVVQEVSCASMSN